MLLLFVDTAVWALLCHRIERGISDAALAARQEGWVLAAEGLHWSGWPFAAQIDLTTVAAASNLLPGFVWRAERTGVRLAFFHPATLAVRIAGAQSIEARGIPPIPLVADRTLIEADLAGAAPPHVSIGALKATLPAGPLTLERAELTLPPNGLDAELIGLSLPGVATPIGAVHLRASIEPALPLAATPRAGALAWRQAGGHIDISEATLHWDKLDATGSGRITLDDQLQPRADGTVEASGLPLLLDDLAQAGTLAPAQASAAKAVIGILSAPSSGKRVQLPLSLEDGVLRLARFPLLRFQPLVWD